MSARNVEVLRRWFEAFNAHGTKALIALHDPGVEFHSVFAAVGGGTYYGHDGMQAGTKTFRKRGERIFVSTPRHSSTSVSRYSSSTCIARAVSKVGRRLPCPLPLSRDGATASSPASPPTATAKML